MVHTILKKLYPILGCMLLLAPAFVFALQDGAARTPPMGFNTWNYFGCDGCNQANMLAVAKAMLQKHTGWDGKSVSLMDVGYKFINLDDCWENGMGGHPNNDTLKWDVSRFPKGLPWLTDTLHKLGFQAGIYTCAGSATCAGRPSSQGYEAADAMTFVKWGFNYLKDDWCSVTNGATAPKAYSKMGHGIVDAQKQLGIKSTFVFSLCSWGQTGSDSPWLFGDTCGHLWRTTGDIKAAWSGSDGSCKCVQGIFLSNYNHFQYAGPGKWNDPDMLEVGNGLTDQQGQSHFNLWCISAAPLLMGNNTPAMNDITFTTLANTEVIAVDQDSLGKQGHRVLGNGSSVDAYVKVMKTPDTTTTRKVAVCVVNWGSGAVGGQTITWANIGENSATKVYSVRDLNTHKSLTTSAAGSYTTAGIPAYGNQMLLFTNYSVGVLENPVTNKAISTGKILTRVNGNIFELFVPRANSIVRVFNLSGKEISSCFAPTANWYRINSRASTGMYIVRINSDNSVLEGKAPMLAQ